MIGTLLNGRFRIVKSLGTGNFGKTFLAEDTHIMDAKCAVKRLTTPKDSNDIDIVRDKFKLEAKKLHALNHQGIPKLISYFEYEGEFYLAQDLIDGHTLDEDIYAHKKWTELEVKNFLLEMLEILAYVHSQGSIHRDIKPNNIMLRHLDKKLMLIDFGAVKEVRNTGSNLEVGQASGTVVIGTTAYMSPEQAKGKPCFASDLYSLGCIAIEALIGKSPDQFESDPYSEIKWRDQARVSDEFAAIIDKMVRYKSGERYRNAGEVLEVLKGLEGLNMGDRPSTIETSTNKKNKLRTNRQSNIPISEPNTNGKNNSQTDPESNIAKTTRTSTQPTKRKKSRGENGQNTTKNTFVETSSKPPKNIASSIAQTTKNIWKSKLNRFLILLVLTILLFFVFYNNRHFLPLSQADRLFDAGEKKEAIAKYEEVIGIKPDDQHAYSRLGVLKYLLGDYQGAIASLDEAIRLNPNDAVANDYRAKAIEQLNKLPSPKPSKSPVPTPIKTPTPVPTPLKSLTPTPIPVNPTPVPIEPTPIPVEPTPAPIEPTPPARVEPIPAPIEPTLPARVEPIPAPTQELPDGCEVNPKSGKISCKFG